MRLRILIALASATAVGGIAAAAPAGTVDSEVAVSRLVASARSAVAPDSPAAAVRRTLADGSVASAVTALSTMRGTPVASTPARPLATSSWRAAARYLLAEVRAARAALGPHYVQRALAAGRRDGCAGPLQRIGRASGPPAPVPTACGDPALNAAATAAALRIAQALDVALPALRRQAGDVRPRAAAADGCDLVDAVPALCVGSSAANTYTTDAMVQIDLGGDDVYENTAGGAPFGDQTALVPIAVTVDTGGNDTYRYSRSVVSPVAPYALSVAQGASYYGGAVGLLVDTAGNDAYEVAPQAGPPLEGRGGATTPWSQLMAQGVGYGTGVGVLLDAAGNDSHDIVWPGGDTRGWIQGQGASFLGAGALIDIGGGDDGYDVDATGVEGLGSLFIGVQAQTQHGAGLLSDDGGRDRFAIAGDATSPDTDLGGRPLPGGAFSFAICPGSAGICASAQSSAGLEGPTMLLEGTGDTTYSVDLVGRGNVLFASASAQSQATGDEPGSAPTVLWDAGGDDEYRMTADLANHVSIPANGPPSYDASWARGTLVGQAAGYGSTIADLGAGNDRYTARVNQVADAVFAERTDGDAPQLLGFGAPFVYAQGSGTAATLFDDGGTDRYVADAANTARADGAPDALAFAQGRPALQVQGGSGGTLLDAGGTGDVFTTRAAQTSSAPDEDNAYNIALPPLSERLDAHGYTDGHFLALGSAPAVVTSPSVPVCANGSDPGSIGFGRWRSTCGSGEAFNGFAPESTGQASKLALDKPRYTALDDSRLAVGALLTDAGGTPLAGRTVHFTFSVDATQHELGPIDLDQVRDLSSGELAPAAPLGADLWQVDAVTGADGVARARLPARSRTPYGHLLRSQPLEITATYDGESAQPARRPQFATAPFQWEG